MPPQPQGAPRVRPSIKMNRNWRGPYQAKKAKAPSGYRYVKPGQKWQRQFKDDKPRFVLAPVKGRKPPGRPSPAPKPPEIPYSEYAQYPFFQRSLIDLDRQQQAHQSYVSDKVSPWLAQALQGLTGVDPNQPGYNPAVQQQYLANVHGIVGGALNAAAGAVGPMPMSSTPGGIVASPTAYESDAARTAAAQRSSAAIQSAQAQSALNTLQPNTLAQGAVMALADYAKGLPGLYAQRRSEERSKIDRFIMEFEEEKRRADRNAAIQEMQARANIAIAYAELGMDRQKLEAELNRANQGLPEAPPGLVAVPTPDGGWEWRTDPTYQAPGGGGSGGGTSTRDAQGRLRVPKLQEDGWTRLPPRYIKNGQPRVNRQLFKVTRGADGKWWIKRKDSGSGGGGSTPESPNKRMGQQEAIDALTKAYDPFGDSDTDTSISVRNQGKPKAAAQEVVRWVLDHKNSFVVGNTRRVNRQMLQTVLQQAVRGNRQKRGSVLWHIFDILNRGYITPDGRWK